MKYIHIKNLEKYHPGYKDRDLKWFKCYFKMVNADPEFEMLCEIDKWRFIAFIMLELQYQKPIPLDEDYLKRKGFDFQKRSMSLTIQMLHNSIVVVTEDGKPCDDSVTQRKSRVYKEEEDKEEEEVYAVTPNAFKDYWNKTRLPKLRTLTEQRRKQLKIRMSEPEFAKQWMEIIDRIASSNFCNGDNDRKWKADIDWLLRNDTFYNRVLEGKYDNKAKDKTPLEKLADFEEQERKRKGAV